MPRSLSYIRFGFFSSVSCRVMFSNPLRRRKRNNCGKDQGMMCMWVPRSIRPTRHGKLGKNPRRKNWRRASGNHTLGVVTMSWPPGVRWRRAVLKKRSGFPKCSIPSQHTMASYNPKSSGRPKSRSTFRNVRYASGGGANKSRPSICASKPRSPFSHPLPEGASRRVAGRD